MPATSRNSYICRRRPRTGSPSPAARQARAPADDLAPATVVLWTFLERLSNEGNGATDDGLVDALQGFYDEAYYDD